MTHGENDLFINKSHGKSKNSNLLVPTYLTVSIYLSPLIETKLNYYNHVIKYYVTV